MKTQMKTTRALDHISKPRVVFICRLIGHQDLWIKTKQIEHKNNTSVNLIIIINQLHCQFIFFPLTKKFTAQFVCLSFLLFFLCLQTHTLPHTILHLVIKTMTKHSKSAIQYRKFKKRQAIF